MGHMGKKRVTIVDVANRAGVSRQTVSRVIHAPNIVAKPTKKRVVEAIETLKFRPDPLARSLVSKRTYTIAVVIVEFSAYTRSRVLSGAEKEARKSSYNVLICGADSSGPFGEPIYTPLLNSQRYEGVFILYAGSITDKFDIFTEIPPDIPVVTFGYAHRMDSVTCISTSFREGAYAAVKHLINLGHRRIVNLSGPKELYDSKQRTKGYLDALKEAGIKHDPSLIKYGTFIAEEGYIKTCQLLNENVRFSAIFAQSDAMALGCLHALRKKGLRVPEDIAVVGYDNFDIAPYFSPPLTTVNIPAYEMGRTGIRILIDKIEGKEPEKKLMELPAKLVIRDSS